jgi:hypothetical protein
MTEKLCRTEGHLTTNSSPLAGTATEAQIESPTHIKYLRFTIFAPILFRVAATWVSVKSASLAAFGSNPKKTEHSANPQFRVFSRLNFNLKAHRFEVFRIISPRLHIGQTILDHDP